MEQALGEEGLRRKGAQVAPEGAAQAPKGAAQAPEGAQAAPGGAQVAPIAAFARRVSVIWLLLEAALAGSHPATRDPSELLALHWAQAVRLREAPTVPVLQFGLPPASPGNG